MTRREIYRLERDSIREFVADYPYTGHVLDYGCGDQPYRDLIETTASYSPWDRQLLPGKPRGSDHGADDPLAARTWDAIVCTQVIQYVPDAYRLLRRFREAVKPGGALVLTGPGCWHEEEMANLHSYTRAGISRLLSAAGFTVERCVDRGTFDVGGFPISVGWGALGRA